MNPKFRRAAFAICILGLLVTIHLWIQKERNFENGCWGIPTGKPDLADSPCRALASRSVSFLGLPLELVGYGFFTLFGSALLASGFSAAISRHLAVFRQLLICISIPYTIYLVIYQIRVAQAICPLCMIVASLVIALFILELIARRSASYAEVASPHSIDHAYTNFILFMGGVCLAAVLVFVDGVGSNPFRRKSDSDFERAVALVLPRLVDSSVLKKTPTAPEIALPIIKSEEWLAGNIESIGRSRGLPVIAFFDPNCPHCNNTFLQLFSLAEEYREQVAFYVLPLAIWDRSLYQVQALELAKGTRIYYDMWRLQFERQSRDGLSNREVEGIFHELKTDLPDLRDRLHALKEHVAAQRAKQRRVGMVITPIVFIDGHPVSPSEATVVGLKKQIDGALAQKEITENKVQPDAAGKRP